MKMARTLGQEIARGGASKPAGSNGKRPLTGTDKAHFESFDAAALKEDVNRLVDMADKAREAFQPVKDEKKKLKAERGYHMGGFGVCIQLRRMDPVEARSMWLTIKTYAVDAGLDDPDLVDRMMADAEGTDA
jgi:hypothetical protein